MESSNPCSLTSVWLRVCDSILHQLSEEATLMMSGLGMCLLDCYGDEYVCTPLTLLMLI